VRTYALIRIRGVYHLRWKFAGSARQQRSTGERTRVRAVPAAERIYLEAEALWKGRQPTPTLRELVGDWIRQHQDCSSHYLRSVEAFGRSLGDLAERSLRDLDSRVVKSAFDQHSRGRSYASALHWYRVLTALVLWAVRERMIERKPWDLKLAKDQKRPRAVLPLNRVSAWFEAVDGAAGERSHVSTAVRLMYGLGLRQAEALGARWEWLDVERRVYTPGAAKNRKAQEIKVPRWLISYLLPLRKATGWMLPGIGNRPHAPGYCRRAMLEANAACGTPGITPHRLRGSLATHLLQKLPLPTVQKRLRHENPLTTLLYTEREDALIDRAQEELATEMGLA
jgi:integrase